jgi:hypothetical protein
MGNIMHLQINPPLNLFENTALLALPLPLQDQALILLSSPQGYMPHFACAITWNVISLSLARVEVQLRLP